MYKAPLGHWTFQSGNACHATLTLTPPSGLAVSFTWKSALSDDDTDRYSCQLLPEALQRALTEVEGYARIVAVRVDLASKGIIECVGVNEDGARLWSLTEKGRAMSTDSNANMLARFLSKVRGIRALDWLRGLFTNT